MTETFPSSHTRTITSTVDGRSVTRTITVPDSRMFTENIFQHGKEMTVMYPIPQSVTLKEPLNVNGRETSVTVCVPETVTGTYQTDIPVTVDGDWETISIDIPVPANQEAVSSIPTDDLSSTEQTMSSSVRISGETAHVH